MSKDGIRLDPAKVRAITDMKPPENVSDMRRFLGLRNHCSRFIPDLADKTSVASKECGAASADGL